MDNLYQAIINRVILGFAGVIAWFEANATVRSVSEVETVHEDVAFNLPRPIRKALAVVETDAADQTDWLVAVFERTT